MQNETQMAVHGSGRSGGGSLGAGNCFFEKSGMVQLHAGRDATLDPVMDTARAVWRFEAKALCNSRGASK